jgi:alpha-galactosidase
VDKAKTEALLEYVQVLTRPNYGPRCLRLKGLNPSAAYRNEMTGEVLSGAALMSGGIIIYLPADFQSTLLHFCAV